jgi:hypothetical protein
MNKDFRKIRDSLEKCLKQLKIEIKASTTFELTQQQKNKIYEFDLF